MHFNGSSCEEGLYFLVSHIKQRYYKRNAVTFLRPKQKTKRWKQKKKMLTKQITDIVWKNAGVECNGLLKLFTFGSGKNPKLVLLKAGESKKHSCHITLTMQEVKKEEEKNSDKKTHERNNRIKKNKSKKKKSKS